MAQRNPNSIVDIHNVRFSLRYFGYFAPFPFFVHCEIMLQHHIDGSTLKCFLNTSYIGLFSCLHKERKKIYKIDTYNGLNPFVGL